MNSSGLVLTWNKYLMRISEIINESQSVSTVLGNVLPSVLGTAAQNSDMHWIIQALGKFGPGVVSAAQDIMSGNYSSALLNAFTTVAPNVPINTTVKNTASIMSNLQLLFNVAKNPATLGAFLALYSPGLNNGEQAEIARIHAAQDAVKTPAGKV
jgi:hypothetical protein